MHFILWTGSLPYDSQVLGKVSPVLMVMIIAMRMRMRMRMSMRMRMRRMPIASYLMRLACWSGLSRLFLKYGLMVSLQYIERPLR